MNMLLFSRRKSNLAFASPGLELQSSPAGIDTNNLFYMDCRGSERHSVNFYNVNGTFLNNVEPYSRFLQHNRSTPIATTAFHPHRMMLACSALNNNHVNVFTCHDGPAGAPEG